MRRTELRAHKFSPNGAAFELSPWRLPDGFSGFDPPEGGRSEVPRACFPDAARTTQRNASIATSARCWLRIADILPERPVQDGTPSHAAFSSRERLSSVLKAQRRLERGFIAIAVGVSTLCFRYLFPFEQELQ
jgi:hypothetical protein